MIEGLKIIIYPKTNERANEYGICRMCNHAWIENPVYAYCPSCMNDFYVEKGYKAVIWFTGSDGITRGLADPGERKFLRGCSDC